MTVPLPRDPVTTSASDVWAGGKLTLYHTRADSTFKFFVDSAQVESTAFPGDSVVLTIPDSVAGRADIRLDRADGKVLASIHVGGLESYRNMPAVFSSTPFPWPVGGVASILVGASPWKLVRFELNGSMPQTLLDSVELNGTGVRMPGLTADPNELILRRVLASRNELWRMTPSPTLVRALPNVLTRHTAMLRNGMYVTATHHYITTGAYFGQFEESQSIAISPDGTLAAVPVHFTNANGMPVFDTTGIPHFVAPAYMSHGAIFSPGSDTLFVGGSYGLRPNLQGALFVTNSRTGDVWRRIDFGNDHPNRVALDPIGPWIYVVTDYHEGRVGEAPPVLYVIDRSTLNVVGRIPLRGWIDCTPYCDPVVVPGTDGLFVVTRDRIARFVRK